jgi:hypothetical protein
MVMESLLTLEDERTGGATSVNIDRDGESVEPPEFTAVTTML